MNANIFDDNELFTPEEEENFTTNERIQRIKEKSIQYLKSINPNFEQIIEKENELFDPKCIGYYKLTKSETKKQ